MKAHFFLFVLAFVLISADFSNAAVVVGGWKAIKNMSDPHVAEVANFAVSEHNKQANSKLSLSRVIKGQTQVVSGVNYKLVVEAKDVNQKVGGYEAVVWEKEWEKFRKLTSFKPVKI